MTNFEKEHPGRPQKIYLLLFLFLVGWLSQPFTPTVNAAACNDDQLGELGINYYGRCGVVSVCQSGATGNNTDYAGNKILTDAQLATIKNNSPFYMSSASKYSIPWQLLAVIHLREHGLSRSGPNNGQGPYQDANKGAVPETLKSGSGWKVGDYNDQEFQTATDWLADQIANRYSLHSDRLASDDSEVKSMFSHYNGLAKAYKDQAVSLGMGFDRDTQGYEGSPYVMNRADLRRDPTVEPTKSNGMWGQIKVDYGPIEYPANSDYGSFVVYKSMGGGSGNSSSCNSSDAAGNSSGNVQAVIDTVAKFAWADGRRGSKQMDDYAAAVKRSAYGNDAAHNYGNDCGAFVYIVMHESGYEPNYPAATSGYQDAWLKTHWKTVATRGAVDTSKLQPGDIAARDGHVFVWVGDKIAGFSGKSAEAANGSDTAPTAVKTSNTYSDPSGYNWYRKG